jgi:HEAT repeat protein
MTSSEPSPIEDGRPAQRNLADRVARRRAAAIAGHEGDPEGARRLVDDPDPGVRATALGALQRLGMLRGDELAGAVRDAEPVVRRRAAELLAVWEPAPDEGLVAADEPALLPLLRDPDPTVVEIAAWAAGERLGRAAEAGEDLPEPAAVEVLIEVARDHRDALCREAAVAALGAIGDARALPAILAATEDKATVRRRAVIALAPFDGPEVDAALERARTDRDWQVRQAAEDLLAD